MDTKLSGETPATSLKLLDLKYAAATTDARQELPRPADKPKLAVLTLNRPEKANSFDDLMIKELTAHFTALASRSDVRLMVIKAAGSHFCAGADLGWMKKAASLSYDANLDDAALLSQLFTRLKCLPMPTLGIVHGSVMGGGVGLVACLDTVIALTGTRFALSEVRLGLAPAVILPFLKERITPSFLRWAALTGQPFSAEMALQNGLVHSVVAPHDAEVTLQNHVKHLLIGEPKAQQEIKNYLSLLESSGEVEVKPQFGRELIARLRTSAEGQAGLQAFFAKSDPPWMVATPSALQMATESSSSTDH